MQDNGGTANGGVDTDPSPNTITFNVTGANDAPVVTAITSNKTEDDTSYSIDLLATASDADSSDSLAVANPSAAAVDGNNNSISIPSGALSLSGQNLTVDPNAFDNLDNGESVVITYSYDVSDGNTSTANSATITITGVDDPAVITGSSSDSTQPQEIQDPQATVAQTSFQATLVSTNTVTNQLAIQAALATGISLSNVAIDFELTLEEGLDDVNATIPLAELLGDLTLTNTDGKRNPNKHLIYYSIDSTGNLSPLSYDPLTGAGARFYDTNNDGIADLLSLKLIDGGFGDKDGIKNGVIVDPSTPAVVEINPAFTQQANGFLRVSDSTDAAPVALALKASLIARSSPATTIGYVILNAGEEASIVNNLSGFKERATTLFTTLESDDAIADHDMRFERDLLLRNGQSVRFFAITDGSLAELSSLSDSRFSFLDNTVHADTGTASIGGGSGRVSFELSLQSDQNLSALIAQEQTVAPLLDFTAFSETDTITGAIIQAREAEHDAITGFYRVLNTSGSVRAADGSLLTPGDAGYAAAALRDANQVATFSDLSVADGQSTSTDFSLQDSGTFAPFAQVNGHTFFAFAEANADGLSHFRSLGTNLFGLEDQLGGGDLDFDDHIIGFNISGLTRSDQAAVA
ncbi:hypothetical protein RS9917_07645 [Synechococcus sp. RS9917]|nr:hypothetical protein RS9917_07645 [Synechococcus sp. RS9917]